MFHSDDRLREEEKSVHEGGGEGAMRNTIEKEGTGARRYGERRKDEGAETEEKGATAFAGASRIR